MNNVIEIEGLRKEFKDFTLRDISFSLPQGHIMGFVGRNGAGKTTTIRLMLNILSRNAGTVKIFGLDNIVDEQAIKQKIGTVFDEVFFVESWTVSEVGKILSRFYEQWNKDLFRGYIVNFELPLDRKVKELSRGMKMKLMLAVALSHEAELLIFDEPTSGLDPVARDELLTIMNDYISDGERSILFSTHITSDLEEIADYITLIDNGNIFYSGTKSGLFESYVIVKGSLDDLTATLKKSMITTMRNKEEFSGLLPVSDSMNVPERITIERPTIDSILVLISKGGKADA